MKQSLYLLLSTFVLISFSVCTHAQLLEDNSVNILPFWEKGNKFSIVINTVSKELDESNMPPTESSFNVLLNVTEATEQGIKFEWTYISSKLADNERVIENYLIANLVNKKIKIQLSDIGQFAGILNYEEIKIDALAILDNLLKKHSSNQVLVAQFNSFKQLVQTKQGLEIAILKHIKFYCFSYGFNFKLNDPNINKGKIANPLGGQPFDVVEKVEMTKLDTLKSTCTTETNKKTVDSKILLAQVIDFLKKNNPNQNPQIFENLNKEEMEISDKTIQIINYNKGIPIKSFIERTTKIGIQNRVTTIQIETISF